MDLIITEEQIMPSSTTIAARTGLFVFGVLVAAALSGATPAPRIFGPTSVAESQSSAFTKYDHAACAKTSAGACFCQYTTETDPTSCELVYDSSQHIFVCVDTQGKACP